MENSSSPEVQTMNANTPEAPSTVMDKPSVPSELAPVTATESQAPKQGWFKRMLNTFFVHDRASAVGTMLLPGMSPEQGQQMAAQTMKQEQAVSAQSVEEQHPMEAVDTSASTQESPK